MASADYYLCDVCGVKAFYDANLNYDVYAPPRPDGGVKLGYVAAMLVICDVCYRGGHRMALIAPDAARQ